MSFILFFFVLFTQSFIFFLLRSFSLPILHFSIALFFFFSLSSFPLLFYCTISFIYLFFSLVSFRHFLPILFTQSLSPFVLAPLSQLFTMVFLVIFSPFFSPVLYSVSHFSIAIVPLCYFFIIICYYLAFSPFSLLIPSAPRHFPHLLPRFYVIFLHNFLSFLFLCHFLSFSNVLSYHSLLLLSFIVL